MTDFPPPKTRVRKSGDRRFPAQPVKVAIATKCPECGANHAVTVHVGPAAEPVAPPATETVTPNPPNPPGTERIFTLKELEPILGLKNRQLRQLVYDGELIATKWNSGKGRDPWRVRESDLVAFQKRRRG